jgi:hypothetical protein
LNVKLHQSSLEFSEWHKVQHNMNEIEKNKVVTLGFSLPPFWLQNRVVIINYERDGKMEVEGYKPISQHQLTLEAGDVSLKFPIDPFISVAFKNIITRRTVAKGSKRGTVKERWAEDDVDITIVGVFIGENGEYPQEVKTLQTPFEKREAIKVTSQFLNEKDIHYIVIESINFPHTKGAENQAFEIKAYSDDIFQLLVE